MNLKKLLSVLLVLAMVLSMGSVLAACGDDSAEESTEAVAGEAVAHTVQISSQGGMPLAGVDVYVYNDATLTDLAQFGETDEEGKVSLNLMKGGDYTITLSGVPAGYAVEDSYSFSGTSADIKLTSSLIEGESLSGASLGLGDVMYDFSVVAADGTTVTLSEMLAEKDMVLINFFFTTCSPCVTEFPYMQEAYEMYQENVGIIALDPIDDANAVNAFQQSMGLTFPMAACQAAWSQTFSISGYPTSLVVDRYGVICLVEVGGMTSVSPFNSMFDYFTGDDYEQMLCVNGVADVTTTMKPNVEMPSSEEIAAVINNGDIAVTYRPETEGESAEYSWPFVISEKNGEACIQTSNQKIESSFSILYVDVELKAGQAVGIDYLVSTEKGADIMYIIVNNQPVTGISGWNEEEKWESYYPCVATEDGTYEIAFCYYKDESTNEGDDAFYMKNLRIVSVDEIDTATYIPYQAATTEDGFEYTYVDILYNEEDGYYHVGTTDGPLLLADLMNTTEFNEEISIWEKVYAGGLTVDGVDYSEALTEYANYASNSFQSMGVCTVNQELMELLKVVDTLYGFDEEDENEWLRACKYYQVYGSDEQFADPIAGLTPSSAYTAKLGTNVPTNYFYYDRIIMPRGLLAEFVPSQSGVYRITSSNETTDGVEAWIFDENRNELMVYEQDERMFTDSEEVSMVFYMEAGKSYFIDIAFWDPYQVGYIYYDIEYLGSSLQHFRLCAPGYFTYDSDATGNAMYHLINGGIDVVLGDDGYYYEDLGNGKKGSKIYCDFTGVTGVFGTPIATVNSYDEDGNKVYDENGDPVMIKGMIDLGGFDFSKTENDLYILAFLENRDGDVDKTIEYLKAMWGEDYDSYAELYQVDDVIAGKYHGKGEDLTAEISEYLDDIITSGSEERIGCVPVDEHLAELLQLLMDKYTFENVDDSWIKLCYYYDYLGPEG